MKNKRWMIVFVLFLIVQGIPLYAVYAAEPEDTVITYCHALQNGDRALIKSVLSTELYEKRKVLLEQNSGYYLKFLQARYENAEFMVNDVGEGNVDVVVRYPDGRMMRMQLVVAQDQSQKWRIVGEKKDLIDPGNHPASVPNSMSNFP